jgi:hypothetical protein
MINDRLLCYVFNFKFYSGIFSIPDVFRVMYEYVNVSCKSEVHIKA